MVAHKKTAICQKIASIFVFSFILVRLYKDRLSKIIDTITSSAIIANKCSADFRDKLQHFDGFLAGKEN